MIQTILSIILFLTFTVLADFHVYWLFGGDWGLDRVFPTKENESSTVVTIPKFATLLVALGLFLFGLLYLLKSGLVIMFAQIPSWLGYAYWFIPIIFILRAIGEFKYVGFFKKVKHTKFAEADTKVFSPLCLGIGIVGILIQLFLIQGVNILW